MDRLKADVRVQEAALIARALGESVVTVLAEPDPFRRAVRTAAALSLMPRETPDGR